MTVPPTPPPAAAPKPLRQRQVAADPWPVSLLVCRNCAGVVVFGPNGWDHREPGRTCFCLQVAWPPPLPDDN